MSTMIFEVYDALKSVGVTDEKATAAAKAISGELVTKEYLDSKIGELRAEMNGKFTEVDGKFTLLYWMTGFNLALTAAILMKLVM